jgi:hypothetical protein
MVVAQLLGHSSTRMVELVYGRLNEATLQRAVAKLPDIMEPQGEDSGSRLQRAPESHAKHETGRTGGKSKG